MQDIFDVTPHSHQCGQLGANRSSLCNIINKISLKVLIIIN